MNYLTKPKLYNPGFLLNDEVSRNKQGLMPQYISNDCFSCMNEKKLLMNPYYNNSYFPLRGIYVNYEDKQIPNNSPYLRNISAP